MDFGQLDEVTRAQRRKRLPVVMTRTETQRVLAVMTGTHQLMAKLLYGTGMRLMECVRLLPWLSSRACRGISDGLPRFTQLSPAGVD